MENIFRTDIQLMEITYMEVFKISPEFLKECVSRAAMNPEDYSNSTKEKFVEDVYDFFNFIENGKRTNANGKILETILAQVKEVHESKYDANYVFTDEELAKIINVICSTEYFN